jgi:hypothetical protein
MALGVAAAALMIATEFSNLRTVEVLPGQSCAVRVEDPNLAERCELKGHEQHSYALIPLALLTALMALGAGLRGSLPAAVALMVTGLVVLGIAGIGDAPGLDDPGVLARDFTDAKAKSGPAFTMELLGGSLAVLAGVLALVRMRRAPAGPTRAGPG